MGLIFTVISDVIDTRLQANDRIFAILTKRGEAQTRHLMPPAVNYLSPIRECVWVWICVCSCLWGCISKALWGEHSCDIGLHLKPSKRFFPFHKCFRLMPKFNGNEKATITSVSSMVATLLVIFYGVKTCLLHLKPSWRQHKRTP